MMGCGLGKTDIMDSTGGFSLNIWKNRLAISQDQDPVGHASEQGQSQQPEEMLRERLHIQLQTSGEIKLSGRHRRDLNPGHLRKKKWFCDYL